PLIRLPALLDSTALLREINVQNLRYEMGWGKPEALAFDQITGTPSDLKIDFSTLDQFAARVNAQDVRPLFAMTYCPNPLKSREGWPAWKDLPNDLAAWQSLNQRYAAHLRLTGADYEIWNEPDINDPGGKMFFSGGPADYQRLYHSAASGIRQGDREASVGGAAVAYDLRYFTPLLSEPLDFASIHAYDNYAVQVGNLRGALGNRPDLPIFLTEYASFTSFGKDAPVSRHPAAMRFFRDVKGMLALPDVTRVYWAQWVDDNLGLLTADGHRKALFNAFKIYGMMPVDRNAVSPDGADGVNLLASSDDHSAGVVIWNENAADRPVTINLTHLPFARGAMQIYRIDKDNGSYIDNAASENLRVLQTSQCRAAKASWTGAVPGESIVFLKISDGQSASKSAPLGRLVRTYGWFWDRNAPAYADFDPRTFIGRLGLGDRAFGIAQIGGVIADPVQRLSVQVQKSGPFAPQDANSLLGLRVDFPDGTGRYVRSVLYHDRLYNPKRNSPLPWGKGGATPDRAIFKAEMDSGKPFAIDLARLAPPNWNRKRILISFILQNAGRDSQARFTLTQGTQK
ncbi:MAG: hypothetical protein M3Y13_09065, partial [Armatimonadota bacterium]|nr:hypothetical protein [Armatimonadota bacterium]